MTEFKNVDQKRVYSMADVIAIRTAILEPMCF